MCAAVLAVVGLLGWCAVTCVLRQWQQSETVAAGSLTIKGQAGQPRARRALAYAPASQPHPTSPPTPQTHIITTPNTHRPRAALPACLGRSPRRTWSWRYRMCACSTIWCAADPGTSRQKGQKNGHVTAGPAAGSTVAPGGAQGRESWPAAPTCLFRDGWMLCSPLR